MHLEPMTIQQVVSLRLNLGSALALSLGSQYSWELLAWILSKLESSWSASLQITMAMHIT